jgi:hypothetical protein
MSPQINNFIIKLSLFSKHSSFICHGLQELVISLDGSMDPWFPGAPGEISTPSQNV